MSYQEEPTVAPVSEEVVNDGSRQQQPHQQQPGSMDLTKYKTKLCRNFMQKGHCNFGNTCMFAHGEHDLQNFGMPKFETGRADPMKFKTKLCKHFSSTGSCPFMDRCGFAHGQMELNMPANGIPPQGPMGGMPGAMAAYPPSFEGFYSISEMAPPPQMKRAPVMELAKTRLCKHFTATGSCPYEARCLFAHGSAELRPREHPGMLPMQHGGVQRPLPVVQHVLPSPVTHVSVQQSPQAWTAWSQPYAFMPS
jgi:hypothetical protein